MKSFAIFAHNESALIAQTLGAMDDAGFGKSDCAYILINGCSDNTYQIVEAIAKNDKRIKPINIEFGDKSNAWNVYVDQLAPDEADMHIFMDGDVRPAQKAFSELEKAAKTHLKALAFSSLPKGGSKSEAWASGIVKYHGMPGGMYALSKATMKNIKKIPLRLPIGLVGDDTILRFLLLRGLDPSAAPTLENIQPVKTAFFEYESFPLTLSGLKATLKRQISYARRDLEIIVLEKRLKEGGIQSMPRCADALWPDLFKSIFMQPKLRPRIVLFPWVVFKTTLNPKFIRKGKAWDQ